MKANTSLKFGAVTVSNNILKPGGAIKWCVREAPKYDIDSGWAFLSEDDTEEFLSDVNNWSVITFEKALEIEPTLFEIFSMPVGTQLTLMTDQSQHYYVNTMTGDKII